MSKDNILFRCAYCRKESFITNIERLRENPHSFLEKEIYWYHWRGKRQYVRAKITHYDRIRKQHKILLCQTGNTHKLSLDKEAFFEVSAIPKDSKFWNYINS